MSTELKNNLNLKVVMYASEDGPKFQVSIGTIDYIQLDHSELMEFMGDIADCCLCINNDGSINKSKLNQLKGR